MDLLFYINWRAFNFVKQKGYFLENIILLMSAKLFAVLGCIFILVEHFLNLNLRQYMFNLRSENTQERFFGILFTIFICYLIYYFLKKTFVKNNRYQNIILKYNLIYKDTNSIVFLMLFILMTFLCFFSLWISGVLIAKSII
jgi:hypothetical protein